MHIYVDIVYDKCIYTYMHIDAYIYTVFYGYSNIIYNN